MNLDALLDFVIKSERPKIADEQFVDSNISDDDKIAIAAKYGLKAVLKTKKGDAMTMLVKGKAQLNTVESYEEHVKSIAIKLGTYKEEQA